MSTESSEAIVGAIAIPVLTLDGDNAIRYVNPAAELFFDVSSATLAKSQLEDLVTDDSPLVSLVEKARRQKSGIREHHVRLSTQRIGSHLVTVDCAPLSATSDRIVVSLQEHSVAGRFGEAFLHKDAARSLRGMAAMLAHEVKNPLSGVRGAAQLLEQGISIEDRQLTRLIIEETDRVCKMVDEIDAFSENPLIERDGVNIHQVLDRVVDLAKNGFGQDRKFTIRFDPSLPLVYANRDHLIQVFLNLIKNACEATVSPEGEIRITTGFQHGVRLAVPASQSHVDLPLVVMVEDNGPGIPEEIRRHIFDPFVTTKPDGSGLGLALVAKLVDDNGGMIDVESEPAKTVFRVMLPVLKNDEE